MKMVEILTNGQILTIFELSSRMAKMNSILELYELFDELINKKNYKNWHLFC